METGSVYRIAYLGTCHGGDFDLATRMVSTAAQCGMQAIVIDVQGVWNGIASFSQGLFLLIGR